jgi:hypothetical protein
VETHGVLLNASTFASGLAAPTDYTQLMAPPDVTLSGSTAALDRGIVLPNVNDGFTGGAPDLGALESGCATPIYGPRPVGMDESNEPLGCTGGTAPAAIGTAAFLRTDTTTQGSWKSVYRSDGANVLGDSAAYPAYVAVTPPAAFYYVWASSTTDVRALLKRVSTTDRVAGCWYTASGAGASFTFDLNFADGQAHQVAIYAVDYDNYNGRAERFDILDTSGNVLDSRSISDFTGGQYLVWNLSGHVTVRVTNTNANSNAVMSGLFFGPAN